MSKTSGSKAKPPSNTKEAKTVPINQTVIEVDEECFEDDPCGHKVKVNGASKGLMDARDIAALYVGAGQKVPKHFAEYA